MKHLLKIACGLPAILFIGLGLRWFIDPAASATGFGFELGHGVGRSTQVADLGAFFIGLGVCILVGLVSGRRLWFYPPALLLVFAAVGRLLAWAVHDAAFAGGSIAVELVVATLLLVTARVLPQRG